MYVECPNAFCVTDIPCWSWRRCTVSGIAGQDRLQSTIHDVLIREQVGNNTANLGCRPRGRIPLTGIN